MSKISLLCRYEDGDGEHLQWTDLKEILLNLPAKDDAEAVATPAVVAKPKRAAGKAGIHLSLVCLVYPVKSTHNLMHI